jgi:superfamily II DNA or RNA helicase
MFENSVETERDKKELYGYQAISMPYLSVWTMLKQHHLLYQLPTGGGKTVVFSEIVRRYLSKTRRSSCFNA